MKITGDHRSIKHRGIVGIGVGALIVSLLLSVTLLHSSPIGHVAQAAKLAISPSTAVPGEILHLTGSGFAANESVILSWESTSISKTIMSDASGGFAGSTIGVPVTMGTGTHSLKASGVTSGISVTAQITVPAQFVAVSSSVLPAGKIIYIAGGNFGANEIVSFYWDGSRVLGTTVTDSTGTFSGAYTTIPADANPGTHILKVSGATTHRGATATIAVSEAAPTPTSTPEAMTGPALPAGTYHFVGSVVASAGAQVSHVEGILSLQVAGDGSLTGSTLRLTTGGTIAVAGVDANGQLSFAANGMQFSGRSTAVGSNRISGLFASATGGTNGFWVATRVAANQAGTHYAFNGTIASGPDAGMTYSGTLESWGDMYGGLLGWLTLSDGTVLNVSGQSVNGNANMLVIVRSGTPMIVSGTTTVAGNLRGTIAGPLAGDQGTWTATK